MSSIEGDGRLPHDSTAARLFRMSQPPPLPVPPPPQNTLNYAGPRACPGCGGGPLTSPSFTWWGGAIGHRVMGVERCEACRKWWVKKTGQPGQFRITMYLVVGMIIGFVVGGFLLVVTRS